MCGILGYLTFDTSKGGLFKEKIKNSIDYLKFRGPDNSEFKIFDQENFSFAFGHTRLSIIDLNEKANQPLISHSGKIIITFNGEIYNFIQVRKELLNLGVNFRTNSDTEVLVNAYEAWGIEKTLEKIDGMFAFGLYDFAAQKLFLCRDRFGKKPLYINKSNSSIIFSSDIRSIKELSGQCFTFDKYSFSYYLSELSTPKTDSIFNEIKKVPAASYLEINLKQDRYFVKEKQYYNLHYTNSCSLSFSQILEKTDDLITKAVNKRLVADVRVAALLSGGIDSSLVVAKMAELSAEPVNTYTIGFKELAFDESIYARKVAEKFSTNHSEIILESNLISSIDPIIYEFGEPFGDSSMIPTYMVCKEVSKSEKVVLGGDGGDEFFGGYDSYYKAYKFDKVKKLRNFKVFAEILSKLAPSYRTRFLSELLTKANLPYHRLLNREMGFSQHDLEKLLPLNFQSNYTYIEHLKIYNSINQGLDSELLKVMNASIHTRLVNDYLVKVDRASMFASLEMRSPFLDKDLAEFAATLKPGQIFHQGEPKSILKKIARGYFDDDFVYRKKMGFGVPIIDWLLKDDKESFKEIILSNNQFVEFNKPFLEKLINQHLEGQANHSHRLWLIYVFNKWASFN